jgi:hypothetical protein
MVKAVKPSSTLIGRHAAAKDATTRIGNHIVKARGPLDWNLRNYLSEVALAPRRSGLRGDSVFLGSSKPERFWMG